jgi:selenophosphate synthase
MRYNGRAMLSEWRIPREELQAELRRGARPREAICLGCAAKVELVSVIYPVLRELSAWLRSSTPITLQPRDDVYTFPTDGRIEVVRGRYSIGDLLAGRNQAVADDVRRLRPTGIILLANFLPKSNPEEARDRIGRAMRAYYQGAAAAGHPFTVGKGHTIQIAKSPQQEYLIVDYIRSDGASRNGVGNNDTISNIDPNLEYSSWVGLFVAMNNSLNDLFLCGVHRNIRLYPTFDARAESDLPAIRRALQMYRDRFGRHGIVVEEREPLGFSTKSMGATVVGVTDREIPTNQRLVEGQALIATRPIGDLAPLTEYLIRQSIEEDVSDLEELRLRVLETMLTPNFEAARLIEKYLPRKGEKFDPARHITACRDMSGPGLLALEELAEDSRHDLYLKQVKLHDERVAEVDMPNPTSGTNGAIIISAMPPLSDRILSELSAIGYEPWVMGRVGAPARGEPRILVDESLARYRFLKGISRNLFARAKFVRT